MKSGISTAVDNVVLQAGQPREVFAEWVVADGSHTVTVTADPDCAVVDTPVVQTEVTRELTVLKPDLWLSDVYNAPADTLNYGGEAKFTVRVSNRSTATLFDKYALVVWAARWADNETPPPENAYEEASRTQYNGIQGKLRPFHPDPVLPAGKFREVQRPGGPGADGKCRLRHHLLPALYLYIHCE